MAVSSGSTLNPVGFFIAAPGRLGPPSPMLADNIDPKTKDLRDLFVGADPVDDAVQVAVMTNLGSGGSVLATGIRLTRNKMTSDLKDVLKGDVRQALRRLVKRRDIQFARVSFGEDLGNGEPSGVVDEANQTAQINVEYRNLRALDPKVRQLALSAVPQIEVV